MKTQRMRQHCLKPCLFLVLALLTCRLALPGSVMAVEIDGGVYDATDYHAPKHIVSRDIESFSLRFAWHGEEGQPYPHGVWSFSLKRTGRTAEMAMHCDTAGVHVHAQVDASALLRLQELIEARDIVKLNGHARSNTALGELVDLNVTYASGESINVYAEGGCATLPDQDWSPLCFLEFFHHLKDEALSNGTLIGKNVKS